MTRRVLSTAWIGLCNATLPVVLASILTVSWEVPALGQSEETPGQSDGVVEASLPTSQGPTSQGPTSQGPTSQGPTLKLPATLPDGRPLRPIAFYRSQMAELVPRNYWPVSVDRLSRAITSFVDRAHDDHASRLKTAVYWVEVFEDTLVSERSVIDIESDRSALIRRSLGNVNLVLEPDDERGIAALPRLETDSAGNLLAVFRGDADTGEGIEFKWRLRGKVVGSGHEFEMKLPRTPQTRIVLSAPPDVKLESLDGVLRSRPGPPPDAGEIVHERELRWYELDAGGLSSVRIRTSQRQESSELDKFVVRNTSLQYDADASGLAWSCTMVVQPSSDQFPTLAVNATTITAVRVNSTDVPYSSKTIGGRVKHLQIEPLVGWRKSEANTVEVTVIGHATWSGRSGWCELPMPIWIGDSTLYASPATNIQLAVADPLQVMDWELPPEWQQGPVQRIDEETTLYSATGPAVAPAAENIPAADSISAAGNTSAAELSTPASWSRVRLVEEPLLKIGEIALRMDVVGESLRARARVSVNVERDGLEPIRIRLEDGWTLGRVVYEQSGRVVEHPALSDSSRLFVLWPEAEDTDESMNVAFTVTGTRLLPADTSGAVVPATWFVRPQRVRADLITAIVAPEDRNWSGEAATKRDRIERSDLSEAQLDLFQGISDRALWFQPATGRTPPLRLETPSVSFSSRSVLLLDRDGDDVTEQLVLEIEAQGQALKELAVQTGPSAGRPVLSWSISESSDLPSIGLPSTDVTLREGSADGTYTIDVSDQNLRGRRLIARRRYRINRPLLLQLPSVPGAASQNSEVMISPGLIVQQKSNAVQRVPILASHTMDGGQDDVTPAEGDATQVNLGANGDSRPATRLRYDAVEQPSITLSRSDINPNLTIVWREQIRVIASSRGTDTVEAIFNVSPTAPLEIDYDTELQLASIFRDGKSIDLSRVLKRPRIVLQPRSKNETIRVVWDRSHYGSGWMRRCRIPRITVSGTVLKSEYQLVPSSDAFAPAALLRGTTGDTENVVGSVAMRPGENAMLVRRNIALAAGWLCALGVFALCWFVAERRPLTAAAGIVILTTILFLWWPWRLAVTGWLIIPAIAAAMLASSRSWREVAQVEERPSQVDDPTDSAITELSLDFSLESMARFMALLLCVVLWATAVATGQDGIIRLGKSGGPGTSPIDILVPVDETGKLAGNVIYIPGSLRAELFGKPNLATPIEARFQSAEYQVRIDPTATGDKPQAIIEAEFTLHIDGEGRGTNLVRLPLESGIVRRIELMGDVYQIKPFHADSSGHVVVSLPAGDSFRIRATLMPPVSSSEAWSKFRAQIPRVSATRLRVTAEQSIDALRIGGPAGRLLANADLGRWLPEPGPIDVLEIDYRTLSNAAVARRKEMQRRYWVHAGPQQVTIDCELVPPTETALGESFQFVVRDSAMPIVTSNTWRLSGTELYNSQRRLITVTSLRALPGPVRLLWTRRVQREITPESTSEADVKAATIEIPEVIAAALGENAPAWIALHCESGMQFEPLDPLKADSLSVDHFLAAWSGYRGQIDRAHVVLGDVPTLTVNRRQSLEPEITQNHHVHVMPNRLEIEYRATITPSDIQRHRYAVRVPRGVEVMRVLVNDQRLMRRAVRTGNANEILLGSFVGPESVDVHVTAVELLPTNMRFSPPRLTVLPGRTTSDGYQISRDRSTQLMVVEQPAAVPGSGQRIPLADSMAAGWIPYASWTLPSDIELRDAQSDDAESLDIESGDVELPGGLYEVRNRPTRLNCEQLITVDHRDEQWTMETLIRFQSRRIPDFIDIEIPTTWSDSLQITPADAWTQQPGLDPSRQIVRVRCDPLRLKDQLLSIRGKFQNSDSGRVSVPSIRVLGAGGRTTHINVPDRLNDENIQWRTSAVEAVAFPEQWLSNAVDRQQLTYLVANPSWSIDLAPLPEVATDAVAVHCDAQVFSQSNGVLVMCHWDLLPGGLEIVDLQLPQGAQWLGAWTAGKAVVPAIRPAGDNDERVVLRVPLSLSRLSQPVDLLIRVPTPAAKQANYLPELLGIPVTQNWLTSYVAADSVSDAGNRLHRDDPTQRDRVVALARSVVESVEGIELVAQRPREEVAAWLSVWLGRYRMLARSAGHPIDFSSDDDSDGIDSTGTFETASDAADKLSAPSHEQWRELDQRMAVYVQRYLTDDTWGTELDSKSFTFQVGRFDGFVAQRVARLSATNRPPSVQPQSSNDGRLRKLVVNGLTLALICGLLISLRPFQRFAMPTVVHPAFWLALMGIFGLVVAPIPVAAALIMVAVTLPVIPRRRSRRSTVG